MCGTGIPSTRLKGAADVADADLRGRRARGRGPGERVRAARAGARGHADVDRARRRARPHQRSPAQRTRAAGLDEQEVIELLRARGVSISLATLERWERTGGIRLEEAVDVAAVYHMSLDELAGRRAGLGRFLGGLERARVDG